MGSQTHRFAAIAADIAEAGPRHDRGRPRRYIDECGPPYAAGRRCGGDTGARCRLRGARRPIACRWCSPTARQRGRRRPRGLARPRRRRARSDGRRVDRSGRRRGRSGRMARTGDRTRAFEVGADVFAAFCASDPDAAPLSHRIAPASGTPISMVSRGCGSLRAACTTINGGGCAHTPTRARFHSYRRDAQAAARARCCTRALMRALTHARLPSA